MTNRLPFTLRRQTLPLLAKAALACGLVSQDLVDHGVDLRDLRF